MKILQNLQKLKEFALIFDNPAGNTNNLRSLLSGMVRSIPQSELRFFTNYNLTLYVIDKNCFNTTCKLDAKLLKNLTYFK